VDRLAELHSLDIKKSGLIDFGKPEGYVNRQVEGWIKRYHHSQTDEIGSLQEMEDWLLNNIPGTKRTAFIHNDYKYDNLVLDTDSLDINAILDWEMATVGHPYMDLGTTLAYWAESSDNEALKPFNVSWMPGNFNRRQVLERYEERMGEEIQDILFFYTFGLYKIAVIAQQIYKRFVQGHTKDKRFASLIHVIKACGKTGRNALDTQKISSKTG
jgi:aminoglycoside phosphotransferase (APT) family kinase protein